MPGADTAYQRSSSNIGHGAAGNAEEAVALSQAPRLHSYRLRRLDELPLGGIFPWQIESVDIEN